MTRKIVKNRYLNNDLQIDVDRPFPIKVKYSNVQHHGQSMNSPLYFTDLVKLRSQLPAKKGVYTTQGLNQYNLTQEGGGIISDIGNYGRRGVKFIRNKAGDALDYAGDAGIDYAANYGKRKVRDVSKRVRGDGFGSFVRKVAGRAVKGIGNLAGDAIAGGSVYEGARPANIRPRRRPAKGLVYTPEQEMAVMSAQNGHGIGSFFRKVAASGVRGIGNLAADAIGGNVKPKRRRKAKGSGIVAPGMIH